jgi:hypothetical protein
MPAFFTQKNRLGAYKKPLQGQPNLGEDTISSYRVKKKMRLLHLSINTIPSLRAHPGIKDNEIYKMLLMLWFQEESYVRPSNVFPNNMKKYKSGEVQYLMYLNRYIATMICNLGYDGWIIKPFDFPSGKGLVQYSVVYENIVPYTPEIMICRWSTKMERVLHGGRRRNTRRVRKSFRTKKTK